MEAVVYILRNSESDKYNFLVSIQLLKKNYLEYYRNIDLIIFYEPGVDLNIIPKNLNHWTVELNLYYSDIDLSRFDEIPHIFPYPILPFGNEEISHPGFSRVDRLFEKFEFNQYFLHPILDKYKYVMRLSPESFFIRKPNNNLFCQLKMKNAIYAYIDRREYYENPNFVQELWDYVSRKYNIRSQSGRMFYPFFEILDVEFFRNELSQKFYLYIDQSVGIHIYRWPKTPLRYLMLESLNVLNKTICLDGLSYQHGESHIISYIIGYFDFNKFAKTIRLKHIINSDLKWKKFSLSLFNFFKRIFEKIN